MELANQLLSWAEINLTSLSAVHLKGTQNLLADLLSRRKIVEAEWSLNQEVFDMITIKWGLPQVDLFASQQNTKVQELFSLHRGDLALGIDALAHSWDSHLCYAFPPFPLIPLVLRKFREEKTSLILIAPFWPKRSWFATVLNLAIEPPFRLPARKDLLTQNSVCHPETDRLHLCAWFLKRTF